MRRTVAAALAALMMVSASLQARGSEGPPTNAAVAGRAQPIRDAVAREARRLARTSRAAASQHQPPAASHRNWFARHPVLTGTMAGAGVGLAFAAAQGCDSSDYSCGAIVGFFVGTGAGIGALGGLVASVILR